MAHRVADGLAALALGVPTVTWVAQLNEYLQLGATAIGIVAGIYAIQWHRTRIIDAKRKRNEQSKRSDTE